ncbi:MAG: alpha/beta hydrolase [Haliscomenobacter sp.]|nr:alpha/beta hydrolase [Haliscomenobacter sp.]
MNLLDIEGGLFLEFAGAIGALWGLGNLFTGPLQHWFIFRPRKLSQSYVYDFLAPCQELWITTSRGGKLNALLFKAGTQPSRGVIAFFHGNAGNLSRWGHLHHFFTRFGYDFFVYDYRGYGKSSGKRSEALLYEDALQVYAYLAQHYPPDQMVLYGRSLGSAFAIRVAASFPARMLILETPFSSMKDLFYTYYPFLPALFFFRYRFPSQHYLSQVAYPVAIFQGASDRIVPFSCAARLKASLKPGDRFFAVPGAGHNNLLFYDIYNRELETLLDGETGS